MLAVPVTVSVEPLILQFVPELPVWPELLTVRLWPISKYGQTKHIMTNIETSHDLISLEIMLVVFACTGVVLTFMAVTIRAFGYWLPQKKLIIYPLKMSVYISNEPRIWGSSAVRFCWKRKICTKADVYTEHGIVSMLDFIKTQQRPVFWKKSDNKNQQYKGAAMRLRQPWCQQKSTKSTVKIQY